MRRVYAREELCIGCGLCEIYCAVYHSKSKDVIKAFKKEDPAPIARIKLLESKPISLTVQCRHCPDPACVLACLTGAMYIDETTRLVAHDEDRCIGCLTCIMVCPFGAIKINTNNSKVVKCDLCPGSKIPACVENCPNEALTFEEV